MKVSFISLLSPRKKGILGSLLSSFSFAAMNLCVSYVSKDVPFSEVAFFRGFLGFCFLIPWVWRRVPSLFFPHLWVYWLRCGAGALSVTCFFWTLSRTGLGIAMALNLVSVVFTLLLSLFFFKEKISSKEWVGIGLIFTCTASFQSPLGVGVDPRVIGVGLLGAFFTSIAYLSLRQVAQKVSGDLIVTGFLFMMMSVSLLFQVNTWVFPDARNFFWLSVMALLGLIAQFLLTFAFLYLPAMLASTLGLLSLIFGVGFECLLDQTLPPFSVFVADALILCGVFLLQRKG